MTITPKQISEQIQQFPNCWLAKNIKEYKLDYESVPTQIIENFYFIFSEKPQDYSVKFWEQTHKAYNELSAKGLFKIQAKNHKAVVEAFKKEIETSPCKIEQSAIDDLCTVKVRKGKKSIHFEYNDFMDLFDKAYGVDNRDFFGKFGANREKFENELYKRFLDATEQEILKASSLSPKDSELSLCMTMITNHTLKQNIYFDFWHKLIDRDFSEVSNGCMQTMFFSSDEDEDFDSSEDDKFEGEYELYSLIKQAIFKELKPSFEKNGINLEDSIDFYVWW